MKVSICKNLAASSVYAQMERLSSAEVTSHVRLIKWPCFHIPLLWLHGGATELEIGKASVRIFSEFPRVTAVYKKNNSLQGWGDYHCLEMFLAVLSNVVH